jgi:IPT/TIG domain
MSADVASEKQDSSNKKSDSVRIRNLKNNSSHKSELVEHWITTNAEYSNGKVTCKVPPVNDYDSENLSYLVNVALNGQQFTGKPVNFRYYDVRITSIEPPIGPSVGGT